jgi:plastocyanin
MTKSRLIKIGLTVFALLAAAVAVFATLASAAPSNAPSSWMTHTHTHRVTIPHEDRFVPYALTIHAGDSVMWVNDDTDDHTVVSDDTFNTSDHKGLNVIIKGTDSNGGKPGTLTLHFTHHGAFVYYCRFHSHLDSFHQPVAPGPEGGIQDVNGNSGTPMTGVIVVVANVDEDDN